MTRDDVIRMAREAGLPDAISSHPGVQQLVRSAVAAEREACAKACEAQADESGGQDWYVSGCMAAADAIRARGTR